MTSDFHNYTQGHPRWIWAKLYYSFSLRKALGIIWEENVYLLGIFECALRCFYLNDSVSMKNHHESSLCISLVYNVQYKALVKVYLRMKMFDLFFCTGCCWCARFSIHHQIWLQHVFACWCLFACLFLFIFPQAKSDVTLFINIITNL